MFNINNSAFSTSNIEAIAKLARSLNIQMPRNNDIRSKNFLRMCKEKMYTKLYKTINKANGIELDFKRENFSHYKGYIGRGNNSVLLF